MVNAFALPGGYIYITRGILAHFNSEAELASVLGHEIGHVTARHGVNQMSKAQLAQLGLGVGAVAAARSELQRLGEPGRASASELLFLKFSRDDERQADDLGLRYLVGPATTRARWATCSTRWSGSARPRAGRRPGAGCRPTPTRRTAKARIDRQIARWSVDFSARRPVDRDRSWRRSTASSSATTRDTATSTRTSFFHPEMQFRLDFPAEWKTANARQYVVAASPEQDAFVKLSMVDAASAEAALRKFLEQEGVGGTDPWRRSVNDLAAAGSEFTVTLSEGTAAGEVVFVDYDGRVFQLMGLARESSWAAHRPALSAALGSFRRLTDRRMLDVEPQRLKVVRPDRSMSLQEFASRYGATAPEATLALVNGLEPGEPVQAGRPYKVVQGGKLP